MEAHSPSMLVRHKRSMSKSVMLMRGGGADFGILSTEFLNGGGRH